MALTKSDKKLLACRVRCLQDAGYDKKKGVTQIWLRWNFKKATVSKYWDALKDKEEKK